MEVPDGTPTNISISDYILDSVSSFRYKFSNRFLKIQLKKGGIAWFELNNVQQCMEDIIDKIQVEGRMVRIIVLKSRRKGISTWESGRIFFKNITNKNRQGMIITHEPEATDFVFKMHKRFLEHLPKYIKPEERFNNRKMLEFNNEEGTGLDSAIRVGTASKEDFGSGTLIHDLHLSELAKWPRHVTQSLLLSIIQCVPPTPDSEIIIESTAKGVGGAFHDMYWGSRYHVTFYLGPDGKPALLETINKHASESNAFTSAFIPWFVFDEYEMDLPPHFRRTEEEEKLVKEFNLDVVGTANRKLVWRRWYIENQCNGDIDQFHQEYPSSAMEAFLTSHDNVFNLELCKAKAETAIGPKARYSLLAGSSNWIADDKGRLEVWEEPRPGRYYVIGGDTAEGLPTGDFSCLDVVDALTGHQVAQYHGKIAPDILGGIAAQLGWRYNTAEVAIERNAHGVSVIDRLVDLKYKNIYVENVVMAPPARPRKRFGFVTTKASKPRIIDTLISVLRDTPDAIICKDTLEEMMFFKQFEDGTMGAEQSRFDDRVMSLAIAMYVATKVPMRKKQSARSTNVFTKELPTTGYITTTVSHKAWT